MRSKICLIRHGITEGNKHKLYYGHADIPLVEEGIAKLREFTRRGIYPDSSNADFYTTGLQRTEQTMEIIYGKREHEILPQLKELNFGDFEMKSHGELKELDYYKSWRADKLGTMPAPNGESLQGFYKRIVRGFDDLKKRHMLNVLSMRHRSEEALSVVVCHGGTISAIMESIYPKIMSHFYGWIPDPGLGYVLYMEDEDVLGIEKF
jgi:alpha-ribazole phosphatase